LNRAYFDSAYVVKCYLNEPESSEVRELARSSDSVTSSALCIAELACAVHRKVREGTLSADRALALREYFLNHLAAEVWLLIPVTDRILRKVELLTRTLPKSIPLRALDAIHIASAMDEGFHEIWTNDRHLLTAASHLGIKGRQVAAAG
jgi:predicted nucleic acid-binding protein